MRRVDLIYDPDCPNVAAARTALLKAFASLSLEPRWSEWDRSDVNASEEIRACGSPTIWVDGVDVAGRGEDSPAGACRLYRDETGRLCGVPSLSALVDALGPTLDGGSEKSASGGRSLWTSLVALPATGAALIPVGLCPACWPAYLGFLGSLGAGVVVESHNLLALTVLLLGVSLASLGYRARRRRGYGPLVLGAAAMGLILAAKFFVPSETGVFVGIFTLVAASVWNAWPRRPPAGTRAACPRCKNSSNMLAPNAQ